MCMKTSDISMLDVDMEDSSPVHCPKRIHSSNERRCRRRLHLFHYIGFHPFFLRKKKVLYSYQSPVIFWHFQKLI